MQNEGYIDRKYGLSTRRDRNMKICCCPFVSLLSTGLLIKNAILSRCHFGSIALKCIFCPTEMSVDAAKHFGILGGAKTCKYMSVFRNSSMSLVFVVSVCLTTSARFFRDSVSVMKRFLLNMERIHRRPCIYIENI